MSLPDPALEDALKALVKAYAGQAKLMTAASAPHLNFMASCISEMLSVDPAASYALGFTYVKQARTAGMLSRAFVAMSMAMLPWMQ